MVRDHNRIVARGVSLDFRVSGFESCVSSWNPELETRNSKPSFARNRRGALLGRCSVNKSELDLILNYSCLRVLSRMLDQSL